MGWHITSCIRKLLLLLLLLLLHVRGNAHTHTLRCETTLVVTACATTSVVPILSVLLVVRRHAVMWGVGLLVRRVVVLLLVCRGQLHLLHLLPYLLLLLHHMHLLLLEERLHHGRVVGHAHHSQTHPRSRVLVRQDAQRLPAPQTHDGQ